MTAAGLLMAWINFYNLILKFAKGHFSDPSLMLLVKTFRISKTHADIMKGFFSVLELQAIAVAIFTQAMKYIDMTFLFPILKSPFFRRPNLQILHGIFQMFNHSQILLNRIRLFPILNHTVTFLNFSRHNSQS